MALKQMAGASANTERAARPVPIETKALKSCSQIIYQ